MKKNLLIILTFCLIYFMNINANQNTSTAESNLVLLPVENDPTISIRIMFNVGSQNDPKGKEGLSALTAELISDGSTKKNSYEKILEKLYPLAAGYGVTPAVETTTFSGRVHKDNLEEYYSLFVEAITQPAFKDDDFNRIRQNMLNYLNTTLKYSSDEELGKAVLYNEVFEGTSYGHINMGTASGLNSITINDVKDFYSKYYTADNFILGIGGGYTSDLVEQIQKDLAEFLNHGKSAAIEKPDYKKISGFDVTIINKQAAATAISMGYPIDVLRGDDDWYALAVANSWFGEHRNSSSHLYQVIREDRGLNYGDYSYIENFPRGGQLSMPPVNVPRRQQIFEIWIRPVPNETRHFVLRAAIRELELLAENGLTKDQFELTKNFLSKYILHFAPSTSERLGYALDDRFYGLNESHLEKFGRMLNKMTHEEVNNAVKKHLQYKNMKIAIITTDAEALKNDLINESDSPIEYSSPKSDSIYEEDKIIQVYPLNIPKEKIEIINVEDLFN